MRLKMISCDILTREICSAVMRSPNTVDVEFLPKGLHDIGKAGMLQRLQSALDRVDESMYDAVLFGYGLCNLGIVGLRAKSIPLVVPRAHDCITLFLGSRQRYQEYFDQNAGTYFLTTGWIERAQVSGDLEQQTIQKRLGMDMSYEELREKYGEENAAYLAEEFGKWMQQYKQITFIEMGVEPDDTYKLESQRRAFERNWKYEMVRGDMSLLERLVDGPWSDSEFLTVRPGYKIIATYDSDIIGAWAV